MKNYLITAFSGLTALGLLGACATTDQLSQYSENDDMYFTAEDRDLVEFTELNEPSEARYNRKGSYQYNEENYSSKNVNPDLIAEYQNDDNQVTDEAEYYVEEQDRISGNQPNVVNNYYGQPYGSYGAPFYNDPFYSSAYGGFGRFGRFGRFGYDPFFNSFARPGFNVGFGLGMAFGSPWGWRNPYGFGGFGRPFGFGGYGGFYDPFNPFYGYAYNPYYGGFGYGGFGYWNRPGIVIINNGEGLNGKAPVRTNVPMRVTRGDQRMNVADVRSARSVTPNRANSASRTRTSFTRSTPDFRSQNAVNKSDFRREANRRILSNTNNNSRRGNGYSPERNTRQYTRSTRDAYRSRNYNNNRSSDFGNFNRSNSRSNSFTPSRSGSSGRSFSSPSRSTSRPAGSRGRP